MDERKKVYFLICSAAATPSTSTSSFFFSDSLLQFRRNKTDFYVRRKICCCVFWVRERERERGSILSCLNTYSDQDSVCGRVRKKEREREREETVREMGWLLHLPYTEIGVCERERERGKEPECGSIIHHQRGRAPVYIQNERERERERGTYKRVAARRSLPSSTSTLLPAKIILWNCNSRLYRPASCCPSKSWRAGRRLETNWLNTTIVKLVTKLQVTKVEFFYDALIMASQWFLWFILVFSKANSVWPDVEIKSSQIFPIVARKECTKLLNWKVPFFKIAPRVTKYLGYFSTKFLSKIAESGLFKCNTLFVK